MAKGNFLSSFTAGLKGLLHPHWDKATLQKHKIKLLLANLNGAAVST